MAIIKPDAAQKAITHTRQAAKISFPLFIRTERQQRDAPAIMIKRKRAVFFNFFI